MREGDALLSCQLIVAFCPPVKVLDAVGEVTKTVPKAEAVKESAMRAAESIFRYKLKERDGFWKRQAKK